MIFSQIVNLTRKRAAFLAAISGESKERIMTYGNEEHTLQEYRGFDSNIAGAEMEWTLMAPTGVIVPTGGGAADFAARTPVYSTPFGTAKARLTRGPLWIDLADDEVRAVQGDVVKTKNLVEATMEYWSEKLGRTFACAVHGNNDQGAFTPADQTNTTCATWQYVVSSSTEWNVIGAPQTQSVYGVDRSQAANANFAGQLYATNGTSLRLTDLRTAITGIQATGATAKRFGILDQNGYTAVARLIETNAYANAVVLKDNTMDYSGEYFTYGNVDFLLDAFAPPDILISDPTTWKFVAKVDPLTSNFIDNVTAQGVLSQKTYLMYGLQCKTPNRSARILKGALGTNWGITA